MTPKQLQKLQRIAVMLHTAQSIMDEIPKNGLLTHKTKFAFNSARVEVDKVIYDFHKGATHDEVEEYYMQVKNLEAFYMCYVNGDMRIED